jgi:PTH1 family peptidyl-tRNA hydrolase
MERTLLIGLGNPGEKYAGTYHNVGWEALDFFGALLEKNRGPAPEERGRDFRFRKYGRLRLVYPETFMNESGRAVIQALEWFGKTPDEAVIFHDDSDLAIGEFREGAGGSAGHRGIDSVIRELPDSPVLRVRIGVRAPLEKSGGRPRRKAGDFVLQKIRPADLEVLNRDVFAKLAERFLG